MCANMNTIISVFMLPMGMVMKNAQKESWEAVLAAVKKEMALPQMAQSVRHQKFQPNRRLSTVLRGRHKKKLQ
jgi:hypothetical protein